MTHPEKPFLIYPEPDSAELDRLEGKLMVLILRIGPVWAACHRPDLADKKEWFGVRSYYEVVLPQILFDILCNQEFAASRLAAEAYLEQVHGVTVSYPPGDAR